MVKLNKYCKYLDNHQAEHTTCTYFLKPSPLFHILKVFCLGYLEILCNKELIHSEFSLEMRYAYVYFISILSNVVVKNQYQTTTMRAKLQDDKEQ